LNLQANPPGEQEIEKWRVLALAKDHGSLRILPQLRSYRNLLQVWHAQASQEFSTDQLFWKNHGVLLS
jgi:hypothetical protein